MSNELDDGVLVNVLRKGVALCGYMITSLCLSITPKYALSYQPMDTTLIVASRLGHVSVVRCLLKCRKTAFDVEYFQKSMWTSNRKKETAFDVAVEKGHVDVAKLLLENLSLECLVSKKNHEGKLLISMLNPKHDELILDTLEKATNAVMHPLAITSITIHEEDLREECLKYLRKEIDQYIRDEQGWTPLQYDVHHNNLLATKKLVDANPSIVNEIMKEDDKDTSAIHISASGDEQGWTPFRYAVYHNNASATAELVDADPSIVNEIMKEDGINTFAVHVAASRGYCETLKVLMSHCPGCTELLDGKGKNIFHVAVENKQTEVIKVIYGDESYTSLVNQKDIDGNTPVHLLLMASDDFKMMDFGIDNRVNINVLNNDKLTPLEIASSYDKRKRLLEGIAMDKKVNDKKRAREEFNEKMRAREDSKFMENFATVATLIATASFAAAFTVPGGFNGNEDSKQGMPILLRKLAFKAFMISNTIAFSSSFTGLFIRLTHYIRDSDKLVNYDPTESETPVMYTFILIAMWSMLVAFATGIYVVLTPYLGLAIFLVTLTIVLPYFVGDKIVDYQYYRSACFL